MESMDHDDATGVSLSGSKRSREDPPWGQEVEDDGLSGFPPLAGIAERGGEGTASRGASATLWPGFVRLWTTGG